MNKKTFQLFATIVSLPAAWSLFSASAQATPSLNPVIAQTSASQPVDSHVATPKREPLSHVHAARQHPFRGVLADNQASGNGTQAGRAESGQPPHDRDQHVDVVARDFQFVPMVITARAGSHMTIELKNEGKADHNLTFRTLPLKTDTIRPGQSTTLNMTTPAPGRYRFFCSVDDHARRGMTGLLVVTE